MFPRTIAVGLLASMVVSASTTSEPSASQTLSNGVYVCDPAHYYPGATCDGQGATPTLSYYPTWTSTTTKSTTPSSTTVKSTTSSSTTVKSTTSSSATAKSTTSSSTVAKSSTTSSTTGKSTTTSSTIKKSSTSSSVVAKSSTSSSTAAKSSSSSSTATKTSTLSSSTKKSSTSSSTVAKSTTSSTTVAKSSTLATSVVPKSSTTLVVVPPMSSSSVSGCPSVITKTVTVTASPPSTTSSSPAKAPATSSTSASSSATPSSKTCPLTLAGTQYQYPHLIVESTNGMKTSATMYNATISSKTTTYFNFDIPASYAGKTCNVVFSLPTQAQLVTSSFHLAGAGSLIFSSTGVASQNANIPATTSKLGSWVPVPGNEFAVSSGPCAAGKTIGYSIAANGTRALDYFQDYNPCPIGLFVVAH